MNSYIFTALHISNRLYPNPMVQNTFLTDPESLVKCNMDRVSREISLSVYIHPLKLESENRMCRLIIAPIIWYEEGKKKNTGPFNHSYPKRQPLTTNFEWNQCIPTKLIQGKQLPCILPQQQKLSRKRAITTKILWMITNIELDLYITMIYPSANFQ